MSGGGSNAGAVRTLNREPTLPLADSQRRLWFLHHLLPRPQAYNVSRRYLLSGQLDATILRRCLAHLAARHDALRCGFRDSASGPEQLVLTDLQKLPLAHHDLRGLPPPLRAAEVESIADNLAAQPFELRSPPLWRCALVRTTEQEHVLILIVHHIIVDDSSLTLLIDELATLYSAFALGASSPLPPVPATYADFVTWQRERLGGPGRQRLLTYWRDALAGAPPAIELPADRPRPAAASYRGDRVPFQVPPAVASAIRTLATAHRVSTYVVLLAAFVAVLARHTRQHSIVVGCPTANRPNPDFEQVVGFFVNTLAVNVAVDGDPSFVGMVDRARRAMLDALDHRELPFEHVVEELAPERSLAQHPVFQVMFALSRHPSAWEIPGLRITAQPSPRNRTAKFDLSLLMAAEPSGLRGSFEFATDLLDRVTVERLVERLLTALEAAATAPHQQLSRLRMLPRTEERAIAAASTGRSATGAGDQVLSDLFERQVAATPEATALVAGDLTLTYAELDRRAHRLADELRGRGVGPDSLVAICLPRGAAAAVAIVGVLKAAGAYVPLDPAYPEGRLAAMLADADPEVVVTDSGEAGVRFPIHRSARITLELDGTVAATVDGAPTRRAHPDNLLYVMYTSGSTGRPKGVAVPQRALANLMHWHNRHAIPGRRVLQFASLSFDVSLYEMLAAWLTGSTLIIAPEPDRHDAHRLLELLIGQHVHKAVLPVPVLQQIAEIVDDGTLAALRLAEVITTGEALVVTPPVAELFRRLTDARLHNHYGPAETHVVAAYELPTSPDSWPSRPAIGSPIGNVRTYVLDRDMNLAPVGVAGQLFVGGEALARGYLGRPDLTADRFVPDPVSGAPGSRLYRTGDLCRLRPDGSIEYLSRLDHQVKIRGVRVEPGEVEAVLVRHRRVRAALVLARERGAGQQLVAYVVPHPAPEQEPAGPEDDPRNASETPDRLADVLRDHLASLLPNQLVPSAFVLLDEFPLTPNRKVDRSRLPEPDAWSADPTQPHVPPATPTERYLAAIWAEVLEVDRVGARDDFFELGGHSLLAMQIVARARSRFGSAVSVATLFEHPVLADFASACGAPLPSGAAPAYGPIPARADERHHEGGPR